jgi:hypothetical protein
MPKKEPGDWLSVVIKVALDWRFLLAAPGVNPQSSFRLFCA